MDVIELTEEAAQQLRRVVVAVRADQLEGPSPCSKWNVHDLINHLIWRDAILSEPDHGLNMVKGAIMTYANGCHEPGTPLFDAPPPSFGDDWLAAYDGTWQRMLDCIRSPHFFAVGSIDTDIPAFMRPQFSDGRYMLKSRLASTVVHAWDVAVATGQDPAQVLDPHLCEVCLPFGEALFASEHGKFEHDTCLLGRPVDWPRTAPVHERLVAMFGRHPDWRP